MWPVWFWATLKNLKIPDFYIIQWMYKPGELSQQPNSVTSNDTEFMIMYVSSSAQHNSFCLHLAKSRSRVCFVQITFTVQSCNNINKSLFCCPLPETLRNFVNRRYSFHAQQSAGEPHACHESMDVVKSVTYHRTVYSLNNCAASCFYHDARPPTSSCTYLGNGKSVLVRGNSHKLEAIQNRTMPGCEEDPGWTHLPTSV